MFRLYLFIVQNREAKVIKFVCLLCLLSGIGEEQNTKTSLSVCSSSTNNGPTDIFWSKSGNYSTMLHCITCRQASRGIICFEENEKKNVATDNLSKTDN